jgi:hypothetical protein
MSEQTVRDIVQEMMQDDPHRPIQEKDRNKIDIWRLQRIVTKLAMEVDANRSEIMRLSLVDHTQELEILKRFSTWLYLNNHDSYSDAFLESYLKQSKIK